MATIPLGNAGRMMPAQSTIPRMGNVGEVQTARALEQAGAVGSRIVSSFAADQMAFEDRARAQAEAQAEAERRQQAAVAEAAAKAKDQMALQDIEDALTDAHDEIGAQVLQGRIPKETAAAAWAERSSQLVASGLPALRDQTRDLVAPRVQKLADRLERGLRRTVEKKDRADISAAMDARLERLSREYAKDPGRAEAEAMALFDTQGPLSSKTPEELGAQRQRWKEAAQYTTAFEAIQAGRRDPRALAAAEAMLPKLTELDPQRRAELVGRIDTARFQQQQQAELVAARAARQQEAALRRAEASFNTLQGLADKGGVLDPAFVDRVMKETAGTPYQAGVSALAKMARENSGFAAQPLAVQRQALDALDVQIAREGRNPALDQRREKLERVLNEGQREVQADPLRAALTRGVITDLQPLNLAGGLADLPQQLAGRVQQAELVSRWAGQPVAPFTAEEANGLAKLLGSMAPDAKGQALGMLAQSIPPAQAQALARQIDAKDRPLALAMAVGAARTTQGRFTSELILRGAQAMKDKAIKVEGGPEFGLRAQIAKEIGDAVPGKAGEDLIDAATFIYIGKQAEGDAVGADAAVRLAVGGDIVEHNGRRVPIPAGMDTEGLKRKLSQMPERVISQQAPDGFVYVPGGRPMGVPEFLATLPQAQLQPAGLGRYMVRSGGGLVLNAQRQPIVVDVR